MSLLIPASVGELIDKITILEIKQQRISDPAKQPNIVRELAALMDRQKDPGLRHGGAGQSLVTTAWENQSGMTVSGLSAKNSSKACFTPGTVTSP